MTSPVIENSELVELVMDSRLTGYFAAAAVSILIYDHVACFPRELELIWSSRWRLAKIIYLWNRYFSLVAISLNASVIVREISSANVCIDWLKVQGITSTILIGTVDFVLMRVWILYGRPISLIWLFLVLGIAEISTMVAVDFVAYAQMKEYVHLGPILSGCYAYNVPRLLTLYAVAPLLVTFIMFAMTVYKCLLTIRYTEINTNTSVWKLFLRDGVLWFLAVFGAAGAALLIWMMRRETLKQLLVVPALVVYSTVASRTLLNIKAIMAESPESEIETNPSDIVFLPIDSSA
ncbi:hypothetical protein R3P38DRAFT_2838921, partial [Favolaschia claudopus]